MSLFLPDLGGKLAALTGDDVEGLVTGLYAVVQWIDADGEQRIGWACGPDQTMVTTQGLLVFGNAIADTELTTYVMESAERNDDGS